MKPPDNVKDEPVSICTSEAANIVTAPEIVFVPLVLRIAPTSADDSVTPSPLISIGSATVTPFEIDNVALFATVVLPRVTPFLPSAVLLLIATTPVEIVVLPVYVLAFDNVNVLLVDMLFVTPPAPEITPDNVCVADDAKVKVLPEAIEIPPAYVAGDVPPKVPAVATVNPPAEITVSPEYVFTPDTDNVPAPVLVSCFETPEIIPDISPVVATCTVESAAIATVPDNVPAAEKFTAPADDTPVPEIVNGSKKVVFTPTSSVAPSATVVPCPVEPSA